MRVEVTRSGGFAGLSRGWQADVDEQPDRDDWLILIDDLPWDDVPPQPSEPDRYTWVIRIAARPQDDAAGADAVEGDAAEGDPTEGEAVHQARLAEKELTGGWRELVDRVRENGTPVRPGPAHR